MPQGWPRGADDLALGQQRVRDVHGDAALHAAWDTFSRGYGPTKALANSLDPARRDALRADFIAFHNGYLTELGICVPREYWLAVGVRV